MSDKVPYWPPNKCTRCGALRGSAFARSCAERDFVHCPLVRANKHKQQTGA